MLEIERLKFNIHILYNRFRIYQGQCICGFVQYVNVSVYRCIRKRNACNILKNIIRTSLC